MSLESLWDPDFALLLAESTPCPGDVFHFLMKYMDLLKIKSTLKTVMEKGEVMMIVLQVLLRSVALQHHYLRSKLQTSANLRFLKALKEILHRVLVCSRTGAAAAISNHHKSVQKISSPHLILLGSSITG